MSVPRIKTIAITALILINAFFGAVIIIDTTADVSNERQAIENICALMRSNGIELSPDNVKINSSLRQMRTTRALESEEIIARALLDTVTITDQGIIYLYENPQRGTAEFYSAGDFEIRLNKGVVSNANGTLTTVEGVLRDMKLESSVLTVAMGQETETVIAVGAYRGANIFNCMIEFVFSEGSLETIRGRYVGGIEPTEDDTRISQVGTALLDFLAWSKREGVECTHIFGVEAGYQHRVAGSYGEGVITPAWLITTDKARYLIDGTTGDIWPVAQTA